MQFTPFLGGNLLLTTILAFSLSSDPIQAAPPLWISDFATVNGHPVTHGQNADPDLDTPDPTPMTPPEPDAVDNSAGPGLYGEADGSDAVLSSENVYRYKKYGFLDAPPLPDHLAPGDVEGQTAMWFGNDRRLGICSEMPTGGMDGLPYDLSNRTTVEGYFNSAFTSLITHSGTVPSRLYTDFRSPSGLRLSIGLAPYYPPAIPGLLDADSFDYTPGTTLEGENAVGGIGWNGGWVRTGSRPAVSLAPDGLSLEYPCTFQEPLAPLTPSGGRILSSNANSHRLLKNPFNLGVDGVLYCSCLIQQGETRGNILLEFVDSIGNRRFGLGIQAQGGFWINSNASANTGAATAGQTYFLVAKMVSSANGPDVAYLKVFGPGAPSGAIEVPAVEPETPWDVSAQGTGNAILDRVRVRIDGVDTNAQIDEIRIGTTWQSVVDANAPLAEEAGEPHNVLGIAYVVPDPTPTDPDRLVTRVNYGTTKIDAGAWHHFAMIYDGTDAEAANRSIEVYLDGNPTPEISVAGVDLVPPGPGHFGFGNDTFAGTDSRNFFGGLDELRVYDAVLTPDQFLTSGTPHTANLIWASSFEQDVDADGISTDTQHDQIPRLGMGIDTADLNFTPYPREFFRSSIKNSSPPGGWPGAGYAVPASQIHYVEYGRDGIRPVPAELDPLGLTGATGICFMPAAPSEAINTHIDGRALEHGFTVQGYFNSFAARPASGPFAPLRLVSQRYAEDDGNARLALGLHPTATGNSLAIYYKTVGDEPTDRLVQDSMDIIPGQWYQWAFIWDGVKARAYLNGQLRLEAPILNLRPIVTDPESPDPIPMAIGSNRLYRAPTGSADRSWLGLLDRIVITAQACNAPFADMDGDQDVDQDDFGEFQRCYTSVHGDLSLRCSCLDRDQDGTGNGVIDVVDLDAFVKCWTGPEVPFDADNPPAGCLP